MYNSYIVPYRYVLSTFVPILGSYILSALSSIIFSEPYKRASAINSLQLLLSPDKHEPFPPPQSEPILPIYSE